MIRNALSLLATLSLAGALACGSSDDDAGAGPDGSPGGDAGAADASSDVPAACKPKTDGNPDGLKEVMYLDSIATVYPTANWRVALEPSTVVNWATFDGPEPHDSAMLLDLPEAGIEVAGFLVSRRSSSQSASQEANLAQALIDAAIPELASITPRASGRNITSLDGFDAVVDTSIELRTTTSMDATELRELLIPALLARLGGQVMFPELDWQGGQSRDFILSMQTLYRAEAGQTIFMGALTRKLDYDDRHQATALHANDLANGSGLTVSANGEARECEDKVVDQVATADIIWVIDESGSTNNERENIASNAVAFFDKAIDYGLDFRMGVTDMNDATMGQFATRTDTMGTGERWLMPEEAEAFAAAIDDPSGESIPGDGGSEHGLTQMQNALTRHLPRDASDPLKIRPDAKVAIILVSDEKPQEVKVSSLLGSGNKEPTPTQAAALEEYLAPFVELLASEEVVFHLIAEPLPFDDNPCGGYEHGYGYYELAVATGGQMGSICQPDLDATLDAMLDSVGGDASPLELEYVPISASITVTRDGVPVPRSREIGWDYRSGSNSIVFYGMPIDPANPAEIVVGYRRWEQQVIE